MEDARTAAEPAAAAAAAVGGGPPVRSPEHHAIPAVHPSPRQRRWASRTGLPPRTPAESDPLESPAMAAAQVTPAGAFVIRCPSLTPAACVLQLSGPPPPQLEASYRSPAARRSPGTAAAADTSIASIGISPGSIASTAVSRSSIAVNGSAADSPASSAGLTPVSDHSPRSKYGLSSNMRP